MTTARTAKGLASRRREQLLPCSESHSQSKVNYRMTTRTTSGRGGSDDVEADGIIGDNVVSPYPTGKLEPKKDEAKERVEGLKNKF